MWVSPNHPDRERLTRPAPPADRQAPPAESGRRLATLARPNRDKPDEEMRISLDEFNGNPFVSARVWMKDDRTGEWWPTKRGATFRMREAEEVADALRQAVRLVEADAGGSAPRASTPRRADRPQTRGQQALPDPAAGDGSEVFDEFGA